MAIEVLSDIIEEMADRIGVYGAHGTDEENEGKQTDMYHCRVCFEIELRRRIEAACNIEALMRGIRFNQHEAAVKAGESHG